VRERERGREREKERVHHSTVGNKKKIIKKVPLTYEDTIRRKIIKGTQERRGFVIVSSKNNCYLK